MSTRKPKKKPPAENGEERRRWANNLPLGPKLRPEWTPKEREKKLRRRSELTRQGLTLIVSVVSTNAAWYWTIKTDLAEVKLKQAVTESRTVDRLKAIDARLDRFESWFGVPPPRNPGK
jgi:hypothetical protein